MALDIDGRIIETDDEGYLLDPSLWDEEVALTLAETYRLDMSDEHWMVVRYVREYFEERQAVPEARHLLKAMKERLGADRASRRYLYGLFPWGYAPQACKIAGMRKPLKLMLDV
ncbi:MAG: TusE/DsrC/DsvC family sulfur relay protein [Pseudomonadota bacterium]|nr:TusE/DsrC/DsvC family sulfur relay protein [Pseudomonadota bacterium]